MRTIDRRTFAALAVAGAGAGTLGLAERGGASTKAAQPARVRLPAPTGPCRLGVIELHLRDRHRADPWQPARRRELMVSVFYPSCATGGHALAHQMRPGAAAGFAATNTVGVPPGTTDWAGTLTHAHLGAPVAPGAHPVVLYSPGAGDPRTWGTVLAEEVASRGYVVVTIDHPGEAPVEFPDGHVRGPDGLSQLPQDPAQFGPFLRKVSGARVADTRFVLDQLLRLTVGDNPDVDGRRLPPGMVGGLDLTRTGMFGQSAGGFDALQTMHDDVRLRVAINMDGQLSYGPEDDDPHQAQSTVATDGLHRPFLLMGSKPGGHHSVHNQSWKLLWDHSTGWRRDLYLTGAAHLTFTDAEAVVPQLVRQGVLTAKQAQDNIGTVNPTAALAANRAYVTACFDQWLRRRPSRLLDGPSARYPQMVFNP